MHSKNAKEELIQKIKELKEKPGIREDLVALLSDAIEELSLREKELHAIMNGSKAVLGQKGFPESSRAIFDYCKDLIGATSGYVALLSEAGEENEVLFLEAGGLPCDVDPELPMPIRGLRAEAYHFNKAVYHNNFMNSKWVDFMPKGHVVLRNVMFAPLVLEGKTVGLIGLANKPTDFDDGDAKMATGFGELAAIALQNSRNLDRRIEAENQREEMIKDLKRAYDEIVEKRKQIIFQATHDHLTRIHNRAYFDDILAREIQRVNRYKTSFGILEIDIDHFKKVNDTYGHLTGDDVLKSIARIIKAQLRKVDIFARWGGEEFMILVPETREEGAKQLAEKLRQKVSQSYFPGPERITISLGVATYKPGQELQDIIRTVDDALYKAKSEGRNTVQVA